MSLPANRIPNRRQLQYVLVTTVIGALGLTTLSILQKLVIGAPVTNLLGYVVPSLFGGLAGLTFGYLSIGRRQRIRALERETEIRRLISAVNDSLVDVDSVHTMTNSIADIVGSSHLFDCTYVCLLEDSPFDEVCIENSELEEGAVRSFHTDEYVDRVKAGRSLRLSDVTSGPLAQHDLIERSHAGVGIAIAHEGEMYGVLTVHFPPDVDPTPDEINLLETIGSDFGYFVHSHVIESERESLADIVERIDDPVMVQDPDGRFQVINEAIAGYADMPKDEIVGNDEFAFMDEATAETIQEMKTRVLETETPVSYQIRPTLPGGRERVFSTTRYPSYTDDGDIDGTIAIARDVTDLEAHQRQLRVLDRVLRHNVNNNMNVVQGYAEMISEDADGDLAEMAEKIRANSTRLIDIASKQRKITEFLSEPQPAERIEITGVLTRIVERVEREFPTAELTVNTPNSAQAWAIQSIAEAIEELVRNSIVHSTASTPAPTIIVEQTAEMVRIRVADRNPPMSEMDRAVLAGANELGALRHGSGLGLWLVRLIVDHAGGTLTYAENDPAGNVVTIELPMTSEKGQDRPGP